MVESLHWSKFVLSRKDPLLPVHTSSNVPWNKTQKGLCNAGWFTLRTMGTDPWHKDLVSSFRKPPRDGHPNLSTSGVLFWSSLVVMGRGFPFLSFPRVLYGRITVSFIQPWYERYQYLYGIFQQIQRLLHASCVRKEKRKFTILMISEDYKE